MSHALTKGILPQLIKCSILGEKVELNRRYERSVFLKPPPSNSTLITEHQKPSFSVGQSFKEPDVASDFHKLCRWQTHTMNKRQAFRIADDILRWRNQIEPLW